MTRRIFHPRGDQHYSHRTPEKVKRGADAPGAKLSAAQIEEIKWWCAEPDANKTHIAAAYGVSRITIWRHTHKKA